MAKEIVYEEWRNQNEQINYPFDDEATLTNEDGATIDRSLFVDARLYPVGGDYSLYLRRVSVSEDTVRFYLAVAGEVEIAYAELDLLAIPSNGLVPVVDLLGRPAGVLVSSQAALTTVAGAFNSGDTIFAEGTTQFAPTVVVPMPDAGIRGFVTDDGDEVYGPVFLIGEQGIVLSASGNVIRVDALGNAFAKHEDCQEQDPLAPFCGIKTINLISPDEFGDFKMTIGGNSAIDNIFRIMQTEQGALQIVPAKSEGSP
jgi:hypothetical protein